MTPDLAKARSDAERTLGLVYLGERFTRDPKRLARLLRLREAAQELLRLTEAAELAIDPMQGSV